MGILLGEGESGVEWGISYPLPAWGSWLRHAEGQLQTDEKIGELRIYPVLLGLKFCCQSEDLKLGLESGFFYSPAWECMVVRF